MRILVLIYDDIQSFPPTLNQILYLESKGFSIDVVSRNVKGFEWTFQSNVRVVKSKTFRFRGVVGKVLTFLNFYLLVAFKVIAGRYSKLLFFDHYCSLCIKLLPSFFFKDTKLWYHIHDVIEVKRELSLNYFAKTSESKIFKKVEGFSMPSSDRLNFYKLGVKDLKKFVEIPNYPCLEHFGKPKINHFNELEKIKLLFAGALSKNRGVYEILDFLNHKRKSEIYELHLFTYGGIEQKKIEKLILNFGLNKSVFFHNPLPYSELIKILSKFHVGLAFYTGSNPMDKTSPKGSNKLYEYGAAGLPVLFYDNPNFRKALSHCTSWVKFTDLSYESLDNSLNSILSSYSERSQSALAFAANNHIALSLKEIPFYN